MGHNESEPHLMSLDKFRTGDKPNRSLIGQAGSTLKFQGPTSKRHQLAHPDKAEAGGHMSLILTTWKS